MFKLLARARLIVASGLSFILAAVSVATAQAPLAEFGEATANGGASFQLSDAGPSMEQIMARLERAEAALGAIQAQQMRPGGPPQPPIDPDSFGAFDAAYYAGMESKPGDKPDEKKKDDKPKEKKWYDKLSIRGYAQFRINEVTHEAPGSAPGQHVGDRSVGDNQSFLIRRARVIIAGDVGDHTYVYLQPDFASSVPGSPDANHFCQIRDWYADCYFDTTKVHRIRVGQSKVPYGWETLQSSSNRLPLDRSDSLNSAVRNERDLGAFYYWTPEPAQAFFKEALDAGLKGVQATMACSAAAFTTGRVGLSRSRTTICMWWPA